MSQQLKVRWAPSSLESLHSPILSCISHKRAGSQWESSKSDGISEFLWHNEAAVKMTVNTAQGASSWIHSLKEDIHFFGSTNHRQKAIFDGHHVKAHTPVWRYYASSCDLKGHFILICCMDVNYLVEMSRRPAMNSSDIWIMISVEAFQEIQIKGGRAPPHWRGNSSEETNWQLARQ